MRDADEPDVLTNLHFSKHLDPTSGRRKLRGGWLIEPQESCERHTNPEVVEICFGVVKERVARRPE
jgi:hypothetical protein